MTASVQDECPMMEKILAQGFIWVDNSQRFSKIEEVGGVAQVVRAHGSYPWCPGFKSLRRHHHFNNLG
jgi:hypothetical protein